MKMRQWRVFRGAASIARRGVAGDQESVASQRRQGSHASRCVSGLGVRRVARDDSLQQPCFAVLSHVCRRGYVRGRG